MKRKTIAILLVLWLGAFNALYASSLDSIAILEHNALWTRILQKHADNPALAPTLYSTSLSSGSVSFDYQHSNKPFLYQKGTGHKVGKIDIQSYLLLPSNLCLWGNAGYKRGKVEHISFNSAADFDILYPYVLGDTLNTSPTIEQYSFSGGVAKTLKRWTIGALIDFRAMQQFSRKDPRTHSIATDLVLKVGAKYAFTAYDLGLDMGGIFYKQTNDVAFFREEGTSKEYLYTGLGTNYARFSGNNLSAYYKATGLLFDLHFTPRTKQGTFISAGYQFVPYSQILPKLNALPLTTLYNTTWKARFGWKSEQQLGWSVYASVLHNRRLGNENIVGNPAGGEYRKLISMSMYKNKQWDYSVGALLKAGDQRVFTAHVQGGYKTNKMQYVDPLRVMEANFVYVCTQMQYQQTVNNRSTLTLDISSMLMNNVKKHLIMPFALMDKNITEMINLSYEHLKANAFELEGGVLFTYAPVCWKNNKTLFARLNGGLVTLKGYKQTKMSVALGVYF